MHQLLMAACVAAALACLLLPAAMGQQQDRSRQEVFSWKVEEYPNPFSYDTYSKCGRQNRSHICDPNGLIPKGKANQIDALIWKMYRESRCECPKCFQSNLGYEMRVAVMPRMESILKLGNSTMDKLKDAELYAYSLTQRWRMGQKCNEGVLILFSRFDGILYTLTMPSAREILKDRYITTISLSVRHLLDDDEYVGAGLLDLVRRYVLVFEKDVEKALRPKASPYKGNNGIAISPSVLFSFLLTAFIMATIH